LKRILVSLLVLSLIFTTFQALPTAGQVTVENELVLISSHTKDILDSFKVAFQKYCKDVRNTTMTLTYSSPSSEDCYKLAKEWAGKPKADIWWGGGVNLFQVATNDKLLMQYKCKDWAKIPNNLFGISAKDADGSWTGYAVSGFGLAVHLDYLKKYNLPEPKTWADLLNPVYSEHIIMCTPARSGSTHMMVEIVLQGMGADAGWAYLRKMAANVGLFTSRSADVINDINKGEHGIGLVVDYYGFQSAIAGLPVKLVYPSDYSLANPDSIAILAGAPHPEAAKLFLDYLMSEEGQKLVMGIEQRGVKCPSPRLPVRTDLAIPSYLPDITKMKMITYNEPLANDRQRDVNSIYENTIEKKHAELKDAWKAIQSAKANLNELAGKGYDVKDALGRLSAAEVLFGQGDYQKAKTEVEAVVGLAKAPPPYETYAVIVVAVLVLVAAAFFLYKKKKKAK
jgi:iron(III) transport system substrate-binding protein